MKVRFTERADKDYAALLPEARKAFAKQIGFPAQPIVSSIFASEEIR